MHFSKKSGATFMPKSSSMPCWPALQKFRLRDTVKDVLDSVVVVEKLVVSEVVCVVVVLLTSMTRFSKDFKQTWKKYGNILNLYQ